MFHMKPSRRVCLMSQMDCESAYSQHVKCCCSARYSAALLVRDVPYNNGRHSWSLLIDRKSHQASLQMRSERGDSVGPQHLRPWQREMAWPRRAVAHNRRNAKCTYAPGLSWLWGETLQLETVISSYVPLRRNRVSNAATASKQFFGGKVLWINVGHREQGL